MNSMGVWVGVGRGEGNTLTALRIIKSSISLLGFRVLTREGPELGGNKRCHGDSSEAQTIKNRNR